MTDDESRKAWYAWLESDACITPYDRNAWNAAWQEATKRAKLEHAALGNAIADLLLQIHAFAAEHGEADFYTGSAEKTLRDYCPNTYAELMAAINGDKICLEIQEAIHSWPNGHVKGAEAMSKKLCELCGESPATLPDRYRSGRLVNRICRRCHAARLTGDLQAILAQVVQRKEPKP